MMDPWTEPQSDLHVWVVTGEVVIRIMIIIM